MLQQHCHKSLSQQLLVCLWSDECCEDIMHGDAVVLGAVLTGAGGYVEDGIPFYVCIS